MQDSTIPAKRAKVSLSVLRQLAAEQTRLEDKKKVIKIEREAWNKEKEEYTHVIADLKANFLPPPMKMLA
jgi:hypothetical protein